MRLMFVYWLFAFTEGILFEVPAWEVLILPLSHRNFSSTSSDMSFRPKLLGMPDLPSWLHYTYSSDVQSGFIYGTPPAGFKTMTLEVIVTDKNTYTTSRELFSLGITDHPRKEFEVQFKITNMNVDKLLVEPRWNRLHNILVEDLWTESKGDLVVTSLMSASEKGDRMPLHPGDQEGVYISYGSQSPFSQNLLDLEREVQPLLGHRPCPKYFKKTSYERYFRSRNFEVDWCTFKLRKNSMVADEMDETPHFSRQEVVEPMVKRSDVPSRQYAWDVIQTIVTPLLVMMVFIWLLTVIMCCYQNEINPNATLFLEELFYEFPRISAPQNIQMVKYASVNKASEVIHNIKNLKGRDYSPHPSMATTTTQIDTLPRSCTESPSSTLPRNSTPRRFEDYETLTRPDPPPYHRNGAAPVQYD